MVTPKVSGEKLANKTDITQVRNLIRPFFNLRSTNRYARRPRVSWRNIQGVRALSNPTIVDEIVRLVESKSHFPFPGIGNTFPKNPAEIPLSGFNRLEPLAERREVELQLARISFHKEALRDALGRLHEVNEGAATGKWTPELSASVDRLVNEHGWSFAALRKMLFIQVMKDGLSGLNRTVRDITDAYPARVWGIYSHFLYDLVDPTFEPSSAIRHWNKMFSSFGDDDRWYSSLFTEQFVVTPSSEQLRSEILLRLSTVSLIDTLLFIWRNGHIEGQPWQWAVQRLPIEIKEILFESFSTIEVCPPDIYTSDPGKIGDVEIFRLSHIFSDISNIGNWKTSISQLILPEYRDVRQDDGWFSEIRSRIIRDGIASEQIPRIVDEEFGWQSSWISGEYTLESQDLLRSTLLGEALRSNRVALQSDRMALAGSISSTPGIQEFVEPSVFASMVGSDDAECDVLDFVLRDMAFRQFRTRDNDLERRLTLMRLVQNSGSESLLSFIRNTSDLQMDVAKQIARSCTRLFIEKLFLLMANLRQVIETRIEICDWLTNVDQVNNEGLVEEIASLKQELANLDTRSDLDSTRIHVDEDSLRDWYNETQLSAASRYIQTVLAEGPNRESTSLMRYLSHKERDENSDEIKMEAQVGSEYLLLSIFSKTLHAFVSDKSFGLDAYLSRRIRHGTLSGYVMTPLARATKRIEESDASAHVLMEDGARAFSEVANDWRRNVSNELDDARKHVIQLNSEDQPRGLIRADWRTAVNIQHLDAAIARIRHRVIETKGTYDVFSDLYALCWACIEPDLAQLRRHLIRNMYPKLHASLAEIWSQLDGRGQAIVANNVQELHTSLRTKLQEVCGWFIRPVFRQDSYSLKMLVSSTISIVRELDDAYTFIDEVDVSDSLTLNRASFDVFGDLLFVVLGNAAKYGSSDGVVRVSAEDGPSGTQEGQIIMVEIQSFTPDALAHARAVARIRSAMETQGEDLEQAAIEEGFSGLRKAVGIINHIRSDKAALAFYADEECLDIRFVIYLPSQVSANRSN